MQFLRCKSKTLVRNKSHIFLDKKINLEYINNACNSIIFKITGFFIYNGGGAGCKYAYLKGKYPQQREN